jgi:PPOX class probable F420-dependent enzyme
MLSCAGDAGRPGRRRKMAEKISEPVRRFLEKPNFAVLATESTSGRPQATPVWFVQNGDVIVINTSAGRKKLHNVEANPRVALAIVDRDNPYQYVQIQGRVVKLDRDNGARDIDRLSQRYTGKPYPYPGGDSPQKRVSLHIRPEHVNASGF